MTLGAGVWWHDSARHLALSVVRLPFTVLRAAVSVLITLPRVSALATENSLLRSELLQGQLENAQLRELVRHVQQAQVLLEHLPATHSVVATVIGRSVVPTQHTVLLNRGTQEGIRLDGVVLDSSGIIGRVVDVRSETALVMLLTDPESRVAALVDRTREMGLLAGRGLGTCELIYLDAGADIQEGDRVVTAGLGGPFPKGLALGAITRIVRDETSGTASATVQPAAQLGRVEDVVCLSAAN